MKKILQLTEKIPLIRIFSITVVISFLLWVFLLLCGHSSQTDVVIGLPDGNDFIFPDFYWPTVHSKDLLTYEYLSDSVRMWICYTPLVYYIYNIFNNLAGSISVEEIAKIKTFLAFIFNSFFVFSLFILICNKLQNTKNLDKYLFCTALFLSGPFLLSFEKANLANYAVLFSTFFIFYYNSKNKILKELSVIFLSLAIILKIAPAVFGILLVYKKNIKAVIRLFIYTLLLLVLPCMAFPSGLDSIGQFINNLHLISQHNDGQGLGKYLYSVCFQNNETNVFNFCITGLYLLLIPCCFLFSFFHNSFWRKIFLCAITIIIFTTLTYNNRYTWLYLLPVIVLFFEQKEENKKTNLFYLISFISIFLSVKIYIKDIDFNFILIDIFLISMLLEQFTYGLLHFQQNCYKEKFLNYIINRKNLLKIFYKNQKQKTVFISKIKRYLLCFILSIIVFASGSFAYYKNYTYDRYKTENIEQTHYFNTKPTTLKSDYKIDLVCVFSPKQTQTYENIFQTADGNDGIRMELSPNMNVSLIYTTPFGQLEGIIPSNIEAEKLYKIHSVITRKSVSAILLMYSTEKNKWIELSSKTVLNKINKNSIQKIIVGSGFSDLRPFMGNVLSFDLKIKNGKNSNLIILITLFAFFIPLIYAFYYKNFKNIFKKLSNG